MRHTYLGAGLALCSLIAVAGTTSPAFALDKVRLGWCTSVITHGVAPIAVATKFGWFKQEGIEVELVNFPGSSDCVRNVATGEVLVAVATPEPVAILHQTGVKTQVFYTAYRRNIFGVAVPVDSPIKKYADLKDKKIGVTSMASAGVVLARSGASDAGLDPDRDIRVVVSGQPAQSVVLLQRKEIDAVSQWDTQYTLMGLAGVPMRMLEDPVIESFPANSFVASADFDQKQAGFAGAPDTRLHHGRGLHPEEYASGRRYLPGGLSAGRPDRPCSRRSARPDSDPAQDRL